MSMRAVTTRRVARSIPQTRRQARKMRLRAEQVPLNQPLAAVDTPPEDFLSLCLDLLNQHDHPEAAALEQEMTDMQKHPQAQGVYYFVLEDALEAMNDLAPEGYFFGTDKAHDTSYGYWPTVDRYAARKARKRS